MILLKKSRQQPVGFTLIELLIVIAIIGILSTIGLVSFRTTREKTRDAERLSDIGTIAKALVLFHEDYGAYPHPLYDPPLSVASNCSGTAWAGLGSGVSMSSSDNGTAFLNCLVPGYLSSTLIDPVNTGSGMNSKTYRYVIDWRGCWCPPNVPTDISQCGSNPNYRTSKAGYAYLYAINLETKSTQHGQFPDCLMLDSIWQQGYVFILPPPS